MVENWISFSDWLGGSHERGGSKELVKKSMNESVSLHVHLKNV